jgi:phospholipid/cholesterol/gamma-HCH transport system permease protein
VIQACRNTFDKIITYLGEFWFFCKENFVWLLRKPFRSHLFIDQFNAVGVDSIPIITLVSIFTGMVFALQTTYAFRLFSAETLVGSTVGLSLAREIAPVFAALMVTARVGSSMAAELGTMRVTEQIDALESMAIYPHQYLVVPRVFTATLMVPLHTIIFNFIGVLGSYLVGVVILGIPEGPFLQRLYQFVEPKDVFGGVIKAAFFGFILGSISCFEGFRTKQGARGVGLSTTRAVVLSSVCILVTDYFLTQIILEFFK